MIAVMIVCLQSGMAVTCRTFASRDIMDQTHCVATLALRSWRCAANVVWRARRCSPSAQPIDAGLI